MHICTRGKTTEYPERKDVNHKPEGYPFFCDLNWTLML